MSTTPDSNAGNQPRGGHAPVTNQPESSAVVEETRQEEPYVGEAGGQTKLTDEGIEDVPGFKKFWMSESAVGDLFTPPQSEDLRDVGEASFGTPPPASEDVIGVDTRAPVTNTTLYPWRAICSLLITAADNSTWLGTAWFISPRTLITAGHCVHIKRSGVPGRDGWVRSVQVMAGRNGASLPFGSVTSTVFRSVGGWINDGDRGFDYGAIILPTPLGSTVGWLGLGVYTDGELRSLVGNITGYPKDKPPGTQWFDARRVADVDGRQVFYETDTFEGQSGGPVYRAIGEQRFAFGVHAYGGTKSNAGTRITPEVFNNMVAWKA